MGLIFENYSEVGGYCHPVPPPPPPRKLPGTTLLQPEYEFHSDEAGQSNFGVEDIKIRNVQRRDLSATSILLLFATVATIIISQRNCILEP